MHLNSKVTTTPLSVIFKSITNELERAHQKFPRWPDDPLHAVGVVNEEVGELSKAVLQQVYEPTKNPADAVRKEAVQAAAMLVRFIASLDAYDWSEGDQHEQVIPYRPSSGVDIAALDGGDEE